MTHLSHLEYSGDGEIVSAAAPASNTRTNGDLLLARYRLERIGETVDRDALARGPSTLWRYAPLLPVADPANAVTLGEGWTPLLPLPRLGAALGLPRLLGKDEGRNPSGTFKDRGASVTVTRLRELGVHTVIHNSSGNAGGSWGLYAARAGIACVNVLPEDCLTPSLLQSALSGALTVQLEGPWNAAGAVVAEAARANGWFNIGTLREPYRLEGKKTMGLEIAEQLGWRLPDAIAYPAGGALGAIAIYKAFEELQALGWIPAGPLPPLILTQYDGCAPIVRAFEEGAERAAEWETVDVLPGGLKSPRPLGDKAALAIVRATGGTCVAVSAEEALAATARLARTEGLFVCPEAATVLVGLERAAGRLGLGPDATVVAVLTGSGLKSVENFDPPAIRRLGPGEPLRPD